VTKKEFCQSVLGAILIACSLVVGAARAETDSKEREQKQKVELRVVEKKQNDKPARNNENRGQRPPDRRR
jgi:hypothetical protein